MTSSAPIRVNRAPVLTLWAAIVAERLGHAPETALSLASAVAGTAARAKARRLGIAEEREEHHARAGSSRSRRDVVELLGREIPVTRGDGDLVLAADGEGKPAPAGPVGSYVARAFGNRLGEVRKAMEHLAGSLDADELNRRGFKLYEAFRPEVPEGAKGWGAKGELSLDAIRDAASDHPDRGS